MVGGHAVSIEPATVTIWARGSLQVTAERQPNGDVLIAGHDLGHPLCEEYEYWITVRHDDVPCVVSALRGTEDADPLALLLEHAEDIVTKGEMAWLEEQGIVPEFFNHMGVPRGSAEPAAATAAPASWDDFNSRLAAVLNELEVDDSLVLESTVDGRFVQMQVQDFVVRIESIGEQYLEPPSVLTAAQLNELEHLGYDPPTHSADLDDTTEGSPNHCMELPTNTPLGSVAATMVNTLRQVHLVESPRDLAYDCAHLNDGYIPQPSLGIPRITDL